MASAANPGAFAARALHRELPRLRFIIGICSKYLLDITCRSRRPRVLLPLSNSMSTAPRILRVSLDTTQFQDKLSDISQLVRPRPIVTNWDLTKWVIIA